MGNKVGTNAGRRLPLAIGRAAFAAVALAALPAGNSAFAQDAAKPAAAQPAAADSELKRRVESLEEQLVDMQVVIGTLESLAKSGGAANTPAFHTPVSGSADNARIEALENQLRALSVQMQQLTEEVRASGLPSRSAAATAAVATETTAAPGPTFGSTTVTPSAGPSDAIGGLLTETAPPDPGATSTTPAQFPAPAAGGMGATPEPVATAALPPNIETGDPKQLYEAAYGYLLQRDYGAAEVAFDEFLKKYPGDSLASNAQYWLGETHFVRGQYKSAAGAFLKGYQTYGSGAKAADSLLKLAMSLDRLGQKDAACSSFAELGTKFPNAPQSVKARAQSERQRVGCP